MDLRPQTSGRLGPTRRPDAKRPRPETSDRRIRQVGSVTLRELHDACDVASAVLNQRQSVLQAPKPCLLTQKLVTPRWHPQPTLKSSAPRSKWQVRATAVHQLAAKQKLHPSVIDGALNFIRALANEPKFVRQQSLLLRLLHLVERAVYLEGALADFPQIPYFVGHRWLSMRLLHLKKSSISMSEVIRRCKRFENIRVQVQGRLMELDQRRAAVRGPAVPLALSMQEEEEEEEVSKPKENLDVAADRFALKLAAGRSGRSSLIWLWGVWKLMHAQLMRRRRKKGELLTRTLIGDLVAPFRHWMIYAVENRCDSKLITYHTYLQERMMYTRTAMDLQNKREDLVLDLQVSNNSCRRLTKQLEVKRREREQLHQRLQDLKPEKMRGLLSRVLDLTLLEVLDTGKLDRLRCRLNFLTRDLAPLLLSDEDSPWRLFGFTGAEVLTRWTNHQLAQFKLVANEVTEAMSKRNSEDAEDLDLEWSAKETEHYGERCKMVRAMKHLTHLEFDPEGVLLAVIYGAVMATEAPHPVSLWPLSEKEPEERANALCQAIGQLLPTRAQFLLQPLDVTNNKGGLIPTLLAVIFMLNPTLPCSANHEVLHAASYSVHSAIAQEAYKEPRKKTKTNAQELTYVPEPSPEKVDVYTRSKELRRRIQTWLRESDESFNLEAPTTADPVPKSIFMQLEALAGPWALERPQDFSPLLQPNEELSALLSLPSHELLLRWVNFHLCDFRGDPDAGLLNLGELDLSLLLELLTKLAPDVMNLREEEQAALRMAHNPAAAEAATLELVVQVSKRCTGYEILTEEVLNDEQTDMMAAFLAELMASFRAQLPVRKHSDVGEHMDRLTSIVLEAANTESNQLVSGLCTYLRDQQQSLSSSLEAMRANLQISQAVQGKLRSFALKVLVKRSQGVPCDMLELAQQLPTGGQRGDLVGGNNIQATIAREMSRIATQAPGPETDLVITFAKSAVEELLKKHIATFRDVFRLYAREAHSEVDTRSRTGTTSTVTLEAAHVLVVSPRHLMKLYRDCRLQVLRLDPVEVEEIYNEVKMHHAMNNFEDVQRFETGLSLEMFVEALLTLACRAHMEHLPDIAFHDKLDYLLEKHLVPFAGSKQDDVVYQLLVDEAWDELIEDFSPRLRSVFVAFATRGEKDQLEGRPGRPRGAVTKDLNLTRKQAMTMSLEAFTEMLEHCGLLSETIHRACVGRIFMNLLELRSVASDAEVDEASPSPSEEVDLASLLEEDHAGASFQYTMCFQEFLDGLMVLALFKEPNPFVSFQTRLEKFFRSGLLDPLFEFTNNSREPRFRALCQALDDAAQKDMSASGIAKKLKMAESQGVGGSAA